MISILLIDDEIEILDSLKFILMHLGHEVTLSPSGNRAKLLLAERKFDVVICDYLMPDGSGEDVILFLESHPLQSPEKFIFFSAHLDLLNYKKSGISIVPKPNFELLVKLVTDHQKSKACK